ncbi:type II toxin-antitoxin system VapC family toxin [Candidatus Latescibacterota bacterium]
MTRTAVRANCLDASALVKLYVNEPGSDKLRTYMKSNPTYYTTLFCFFETLSVLKVKWLYKKEITEVEYKKATFSLTAWFSSVSQNIEDLDFTSQTIFTEVQKIVTRYTLDLSDAFQILSVKEGFFSNMVDESKTIFITADDKLAKVARQENIKVWNLLCEQAP